MRAGEKFLKNCRDIMDGLVTRSETGIPIGFGGNTLLHFGTIFALNECCRSLRLAMRKTKNTSTLYSEMLSKGVWSSGPTQEKPYYRHLWESDQKFSKR